MIVAKCKARTRTQSQATETPAGDILDDSIGEGQGAFW